ncbi:hypothetical protein LTV02_11900 [Nocardia yamanashiensis]|uniref:hypothetical protein n=1 Tax=Nocardia yamanashiensis TaxID=209247 RepID=UPI001E571899|nr:hypothetical protein [Nocardia yamanashiensis]UGT44035.1 hypothetical protein LTV02_11900 [Nocardia yamanashiensis]
MEVTAQWVRTWWTKQSRSGAAATRRNQLPVAFPLPEIAAPLTHEVVMREWHYDFEPESSILYALPDRSEVAIKEEGSTLRVMPASAQPKGVIRRRPPAVRIREGEWLRWQITYRHASLLGRGPWYYRLDTLNVAYGPVTANVFLGTPSRFVDERAQLTTYHRQRSAR